MMPQAKDSPNLSSLELLVDLVVVGLMEQFDSVRLDMLAI
jgi:hypothetical protein